LICRTHIFGTNFYFLFCFQSPCFDHSDDVWSKQHFARHDWVPDCREDGKYFQLQVSGEVFSWLIKNYFLVIWFCYWN